MAAYDVSRRAKLDAVVLGTMAWDIKIRVPNDLFDPFLQAYQSFASQYATTDASQRPWHQLQGKWKRIYRDLNPKEKERCRRQELPGGAAFNIAQHIAARGDRAFIMGVLLEKGRKSSEFRRWLEAAGIIGNYVRYPTKDQKGRGRKLPECVYLECPEREGFEGAPLIAFAGNVEESVRDYTIFSSQLNAADILILPSTNPEVAHRAVYGGRGRRPFEKYLVYNPGHTLRGRRAEDIHFRDIIKKTQLFIANEAEMTAIQEELNLEAPSDLFVDNRDLEYIIHTRGSRGSTLYQRVGRREMRTFHQSLEGEGRDIYPLSPTETVDTIGAGDTYLAVVTPILYRRENPALAIREASRAAMNILMQDGAVLEEVKQRKQKKFPFELLRVGGTDWDPEITDILEPERKVANGE